MSIFSAPLFDDYETVGKAAAVMSQLTAYAVAIAVVAYWVVVMVRPKHKNLRSPTKKQMVPIALATIASVAATVILARLQRRGVDSSAAFAAIAGIMATSFVALGVFTGARNLIGDEEVYDSRDDSDDGDDSDDDGIDRYDEYDDDDSDEYDDDDGDLMMGSDDDEN